jgi:hypothetical protein
VSHCNFVAIVLAIRCSYNEVNGVPACANPWLLETVARGEWGFDGYVTGQYHTTRPLAPPYSLHTVLLKVESYNDVTGPRWHARLRHQNMYD